MVRLDEATSVKYNRDGSASSRFRGLEVAAGAGGGGAATGNWVVTSSGGSNEVRIKDSDTGADLGSHSVPSTWWAYPLAASMVSGYWIYEVDSVHYVEYREPDGTPVWNVSVVISDERTVALSKEGYFAAQLDTGKLIVLDPDGNYINSGGSSGISSGTTGGRNIGINDDGSIVAIAISANELRAYDVATGTLLWNVDPEIFSTPSFLLLTDEHLYMTDVRGSFAKHLLDDGSLIWSNTDHYATGREAGALILDSVLGTGLLWGQLYAGTAGPATSNVPLWLALDAETGDYVDDASLSGITDPRVEKRPDQRSDNGWILFNGDDASASFDPTTMTFPWTTFAGLGYRGALIRE